jgi:hypothetical protein
MGRRTIRSVAVLTALVLVAAACSKPKSQGDNSVAAGGIAAPEVAAPVNAAAGTATTDTTAAAAATTDANASASNVNATGVSPAARVIAPTAEEEAQARAVGSLIKPQSSARQQPYYSGVGEDTIKLVFSIDETSCGVNVTNALTAAGGALPTTSRFYRAAPTQQDRVVAENKEAIDLMVQYWNAHAWDAAEYAPEVRKLMGDDPNNQIYGRHLVHEIVDGGSNQCPEKTTAAAKEAIEKDAFVVYNNYDGAQYNMAAALNAQPADSRPMHFGTLWLSDQDYTRFAPYAWTQFATGSTIVRQYASYVCTRVATGDVPARAPAVTDPHKRVFGLVHTNVEQDVRLANELKGYLKSMCGLEPKEIVYEGTDFGKAQQDNPNVIVQLKVAGVTSVLMLTEPIQPLFQLQVAKQQNYYPEWIFSSFGYADSNTVQRLYDQDEVKGSFGTSNLGVWGGFGFGAGDPFRMYHETHQVAPSGTPCDPTSDEGMDHDEAFCKAPGALVTWYYTMLASIGGMLFAGPDLRPQTVSAGLQHYPTTRYGGSGPTTDPRPALVGAGEGKYGFIVDAVEWRWRPEFTSPMPENKAGWVEYPDCMRHYLQWPNNLAPMWEADGPNYNAWCGDDKGYPRVPEEDKLG